MQIYMTDIRKDISQNTWKEWMELIPKEEKIRIERFHFEEDKKRSLYGLMAVYSVASRELGEDIRSLRLERSEYGKPCFHGLENYFFNISHSGNLVILITGDFPVGIDIEYMKARKNEDMTARRIMTVEEYKFYKSLEHVEERCRFFYSIWTIKECYMKYTGKGLGLGAETINTAAPEKFFAAEAKKQDFVCMDIITSGGVFQAGSVIIEGEYVAAFLPALKEEERLEFIWFVPGKP